MSIHPFPPPSGDTDAERATYYRRFLHELVEVGMDLARAVHARVKAINPRDPAAASSLADLALAYERVSRGIRRTIMLAERVGALAPPTAAHHRASARRRIVREVEDAIQRDAKPSERDVLRAELRERLDGPDVLEDVDHRPIPEIIAEICRDLGLAALPGLKPYKRRTPEDIAALCELAAQPRFAASEPPSPAPTSPAPTSPEQQAEQSKRLLHRLFPQPDST